MSKEVQDGHTCENCLRWSECNGVDWPTCQGLRATAELVAAVSAGIISPNEARRRMGLLP